MKKTQDPKKNCNTKNEGYPYTLNLIDFCKGKNTVYREPKVEVPVKYSMCTGCRNCGAYYNES